MRYRSTAICAAILGMFFLAACAGGTADVEQSAPSTAVEILPPPPEVPAAKMDIPAAKPDGWKQFVAEEIYFDQGSYALGADDRALLRDKAEWLKQHPAVSVVIQGHSDESGSAEYNFALGDRRAGEVKSYLIGMDIEPERLTVVSFGRERPVTRTGDKTLNRRVRFEIDSVQTP